MYRARCIFGISFECTQTSVPLGTQQMQYAYTYACISMKMNIVQWKRTRNRKKKKNVKELIDENENNSFILQQTIGSFLSVCESFVEFLVYWFL